MKFPVYLDHHATTPVDVGVFEAMRPYFTELYGNPASRGHSLGWQAEEAVENARAEVADCLAALPDEIVFTSGATEANALALRGALGKRDRSSVHIITAATEHSSVLETCRALQAEGAALTVLPVAPDGTLDPESVRAALTDRTVLVSIMTANNEIGTLAPIAEIAQITRPRGVLLHTDASQALGNIPVSVDTLGCDLLSLSAHKCYGPKGVGALYVRRRDRPVRLQPIQQGGGHERGLRPGTLNVPAIVGLGKACALIRPRLAADAVRHRMLRDRLRDRFLADLADHVVNGTMTNRLPNNLNVSFAGVGGESLFLGLRDLAVSNGAACHSTHRNPSHVLKALGREDALAHASIRFGLGRSNTEAEVEYAAERVILAVRRLRAQPAQAQATAGRWFW